MIDESMELWERIASRSDEELLAMVAAERARHSEEALAYAEAELQRRGLHRPWIVEAPAAAAPGLFSPGAGSGSADDEAGRPEAALSHPVGPRPGGPRQVAFRVFRGTFISWDDLFRQAAEFASGVGAERVISISHSADQGDGVVTVWYWS